VPCMAAWETTKHWGPEPQSPQRGFGVFVKSEKLGTSIYIIPYYMPEIGYGKRFAYCVWSGPAESPKVSLMTIKTASG
jgi:hypothetical protein